MTDICLIYFLFQIVFELLLLVLFINDFINIYSKFFKKKKKSHYFCKISINSNLSIVKYLQLYNLYLLTILINIIRLQIYDISITITCLPQTNIYYQISNKNHENYTYFGLYNYCLIILVLQIFLIQYKYKICYKFYSFIKI